MKRPAFLVDSDRCIGCHSCEMACKNEYQLDPQIRWRKVYPLPEDGFGSPGRYYMSLSCNHCADPACLKACPVIAYTKLDDGIVVHNQSRCIGCRMCLMACPYRSPQYNEKKGKVEKCHMCFERQANSQKPACVAGCPMEALSVVEAAEPIAKATATIPGYPDPGITQSPTKFIRPIPAIQVRRDA